MSYKTFIEWCQHTFNSWWGCVRVSEACKRCYAAGRAARFGHKVWGAAASRRLAPSKAWPEPLRWDAAARAAGIRERVLCLSMGDVFEGRRDLDPPRTKLWTLIETTPNLDWLLLTKRPESVGKLVPWGAGERPRNVWLRVTAETQQRAEERIPLLLQDPAVVRFVSAEPLLEKISLKRYMSGNRLVDWVIAGGESGAGARPSDPVWFRQLRDECVEDEVAFFFKQWGNHVPGEFGGLVRLRSERRRAGFSMAANGMRCQMRAPDEEPSDGVSPCIETAEPRYASEDLGDAEAAHHAELAAELTDVDFEPVAESELRRRFHREGRARRTWLRVPTAPRAKVPFRRRALSRRCPSSRPRACRRHRERPRVSPRRCARGDTDDGDGPEARRPAGEDALRIRDKSLELGCALPRLELLLAESAR
jgi:protein gp37